MKFNLLRKSRGKLVTGTSILALTLIFSFNEAWFVPGLTNPEPFDLSTDTAFPTGGVATDPYEVAFPNVTFDSPITFSLVPNQTKIVIGQLDGKIYWIEEDNFTTSKTEIVDFSAEVGDRNEGQVWDGGFLGLAIHPDFGTGAGSDYFYIYYTTSTANPTLGSPQGFSCNVETFGDNYLKLERFEVNPATMAFVANSRLEMITRRLYNTTHRGGGMEFGDDGFLYLSTGDQAAYINAQELDENLDGGVLRLDVDEIGGGVSHAPIRTLSSPGAGESDEFSGIGYFIPNDNPFPSPTGDTFEEYYTIGHRNPHRMTKDRATGTFYIGEIGESTHEEINVVGSGNNYGWPLFEASAASPEPGCVTQLYNNMNHELPLVEFNRSEAQSIIGGYVYRGTDVPELVGKYIAADYVQNTIWNIDIGTGAKQLLGTFAPQDVISFGQDTQGELYFLKLGDGVNLYRMTSTVSTGSAPSLLSQTGVFSDLQNLTVSDGFIPYEMIESFWSDGAYKTRFMAVPNDGTHDTAAEQVQWSENGDWQFPVGSVLVKHFDYPIDDDDPSVTRKIETRFSIKGTDGSFYYLTYKWRADESDADLIDMTVGDTADITVATSGGGTRTVNWIYPSNSQCIQCHDPALGGTLGPRTRSLNKDFDYSDKGGVVGNQLVTLSTLGILDESITDLDTPNYQTHVEKDDLTATLDERARSYLDVNCAYCHQPATNNRAEFDLRLFNSMAETGLLTAGINQEIPAMGADQEILFPSDASKSQIHFRAASLDPGVMMPPLAKGIVDTEGVALIESWINAMAPIMPPPADGTYRIVNRATSQTMQVPTAGNTNSENVEQGGYQGQDYQHFVLETFGDDYQLRSGHTPDKYLDVEFASTDPDTNVWQYIGNGSDAQVWQIVDAGDGTYHIISKLSGYYLGVDGTGNILVQEFDDSDAQRWEFNTPDPGVGFGITVDKEFVSVSEDGTTEDFTVVLDEAPTNDVILQLSIATGTDEISLSQTTLTFTSANWDTPQTVTVTGQDDGDADGAQYMVIDIIVDPSSDVNYLGFAASIDAINLDNDGGGTPPALGIYRIVNVSSGQTMQVPSASTLNGANVAQGGYQNTDNQNFELEYGSNGYYQLRATHTVDKYLDVELASTDPDTNVWQYEGNGSDPQLWQIVDLGDGTFNIVSKLSGHYLGIDGTNNILVQTVNGSDAQRWEFRTPGTTGDFGITVSKELITLSEDGTTDDFTVVLDAAPSSNVVLLLNSNDASEASLSATTLTFTTANWDTPQTITVTGLDDADADGAQYFEIDITVDGISDPDYIGFEATVNVINSDNDGGGNPPSSGIYRLVNVGSGDTMQVPTAGNLNSENVETGDYQNLDYQHIVLEYFNSGYYQLRTGHTTDKYLDVELGSTDPDTNVWQYIGNGSDPQLWQIIDLGDGTFNIVSKLSGHYIGIDGTGNVLVQTVDGTDEQRWEFRLTGFGPTAVASADVLTGNAPLAVQFTGDQSTDDVGIESYAWDFGDGVGTSTDANPNYTFNDGGTYTVTLTVTDAGGLEDNATLEITVNGGPTAVASADVLTGNAPLAVQFTGDQSTDDVGIESYAWDFGDGIGTSTDANPSYTFNDAGTFTVTLTVTDAGGLEDSATLEITVNGGPTAVASADVLTGNAPLAVQFTGDQSTDDVGIESYAWDFGDGVGTSTDANPNYTFNDGGTYTVTLTVTDAGGLEDSATLEITVNGGPTAVATTDVLTGNAPLAVQFTGDQSTDDVGIESYAWDFGDGIGTSTDANPSYTFNDGGTYTVTLTVTDAGGLEDSATLEITVNGGPTAVATADLLTGNAPLAVQFTGDQSTDDVGIESYAWDFGDGVGTSTDANPSYTFTESGTFTVTLTVTDAGGLSDTATLEISTNGSPIAVASADVLSGDAPLSVQFTGDQSTDDVGIVSYAWDFGDGVGTSTDINPSYVFTEEGTFTVTLTVTDADGLSDNAELTIVVSTPNSGPTAVASADVQTGNAPLTVQFTGDQSTDDVGIVSYSWNFGDGVGTSTVANPSYTFTDSGTFTVTLTVTDAGGLSDTATLEISTNGSPVAVASADVLSGDAPLTVQFTGDQSTDDVGIVSYAWNFGDGVGTSDQANPSYMFTEAGTFTVTLTVTDADGLSDSADLTIVVLTPNAGPIAVASADVLTGNAPLTVQFTGDQSTDDVGIESYSWNFGDGAGTSTDSNPSYIFTEPGTYTVTLTVSDADGLSDSAEITIVVTTDNDGPVAVASADVLNGDVPLTVQFTGDQSTDDVGIESYAWNFGDGVGTSAEANPSYTYSEAGTYTITLTVTDADGLSDSAELEIEVVDNEVSAVGNELIISPNPASNFANILVREMMEGTVITSFQLHDSSGRVIKVFGPGDVFSENDIYQIPIYDLRDEMYFVYVSFNNADPITVKFLVRN